MRVNSLRVMTLGGVDKSPGGDSPDAARGDSTLISMQEIGGDPGPYDRRGMGVFRAFVTETGPLRGCPPRDHRRTLDGIFWVTRTGASWRDVPEALGNWNAVHREFRRWTAGGLWDLMMEALAHVGSDNAVQMVDSTVIRAHHCAAGARGAQDQALGRSRSGFSTKIHARTNAEALPIALLLPPGEGHDSTAFSDLMEDHDADPDVMLADRGNDSDAVRDEIRAWRRARNSHQEEPTCPALG